MLLAIATALFNYVFQLVAGFNFMIRLRFVVFLVSYIYFLLYNAKAKKSLNNFLNFFIFNYPGFFSKIIVNAVKTSLPTLFNHYYVTIILLLFFKLSYCLARHSIYYLLFCCGIFNVLRPLQSSSYTVYYEIYISVLGTLEATTKTLL